MYQFSKCFKRCHRIIKHYARRTLSFKYRNHETRYDKLFVKKCQREINRQGRFPNIITFVLTD